MHIKDGKYSFNIFLKDFYGRVLRDFYERVLGDFFGRVLRDFYGRVLRDFRHCRAFHVRGNQTVSVHIAAVEVTSSKLFNRGSISLERRDK